MLIAGLAGSQPRRLVLLSLAAVGGFGLALLGLFSIGLVLLAGAAAAAGAYVATLPRAGERGRAWLTVVGVGCALAALGAAFFGQRWRPRSSAAAAVPSSTAA